MLRQIECKVQKEPIIKNRVLPASALSFLKFCFELFIQSWFDIPTTQTSIFIPFESVGVLLDGASSHK